MSFKSIELEPEPGFVLKALEIGLSSNCNFKCDYCCAYNLNDRNFLRAERVIEILDDAPDLQRVKLSGGEVLIYFDECVKVLQYCKARGLGTQINTNGSLLNHEKIRQLEDVGLDCLHFSFNFTNAEDFCSYYNQVPAVFERIEQNLAFAAGTAMETVAETVLFKSTEHTLVDVHYHLYDLGVRCHEIQNGIPIAKNDWDEVLPQDRIETVIEDLIARKRQTMRLYFSCIDIDPHGPFYERVLSFLLDGSVHFPSCIEGCNQLHVHSNGDILICELGHPEVIGNLNDGLRLANILEDRPLALEEFLQRRSKYDCSCVIRTLVQPKWAAQE